MHLSSASFVLTITPSVPINDRAHLIKYLLKNCIKFLYSTICLMIGHNEYSLPLNFYTPPYKFSTSYFFWNPFFIVLLIAILVMLKVTKLIKWSIIRDWLKIHMKPIIEGQSDNFLSMHPITFFVCVCLCSH